MSDFLEKINQLPEEAQDYLCSEKLSENNIAIIKKYNFSDEQEKEFLDILDKLFLKEISSAVLPSVILSKLKIKDDKAVQGLTEDIIGEILSPIADYLGVKKAVKKEDSLADKAIKKFSLQFDAPPPVIPASSSVIPAKAGIPSANGEIPHQVRDDKINMKARFYEAANSFSSGARTKTQLRNVLIKEISAGGLGMEKDLAEQVADFFASYQRLKEMETKKSTKIVIARPQAEAIPLQSRSPRPDKSGLAMTEQEAEDDKKEAEKMKKKIEGIKIGAPKLMSVTEGVNKALQEINLTFPSGEINERLRSVIDARIRNVRTSLQTFEKLTTDIKSGGLGLPKIEADKISLILNKYLEGKSKDIYESKVAEIKQFEERVKTQQMEREGREEDRRQKFLNEKFKKLTGKEAPLSPLKKVEEVLPVIARSEATKQSRESGGSPRPDKSGFAMTSEKEEKKSSRSIPLPAEEVPYFQTKKQPVIPDVSSVIASKSEAIPPQSRSPRPETSGLAMTMRARPVVEDIAFTPKLFGPIEEIGNLTLIDFRKLSGDPKEAILKIKDKLSLLRQESFKQYQAGLDAWKKSPVYGEYLKIIGQSLSGTVSLEEILNSGKSLTKEEFNAIIRSGVD